MSAHFSSYRVSVFKDVKLIYPYSVNCHSVSTHRIRRNCFNFKKAMLFLCGRTDLFLHVPHRLTWGIKWNYHHVAIVLAVDRRRRGSSLGLIREEVRWPVLDFPLTSDWRCVGSLRVWSALSTDVSLRLACVQHWCRGSGWRRKGATDLREFLAVRKFFYLSELSFKNIYVAKNPSFLGKFKRTMWAPIHLLRRKFASVCRKIANFLSRNHADYDDK